MVLILERGDMWSVYDSTDVFMITTNPKIKNNGEVVMGRGIAREARDRIPGLAKDFGDMLRKYPSNIGYIGQYGRPRVYWFMVKDHWAEPARLDIIKRSVDELQHYYGYTDERVDLNFPGIGNGGLPREEVLPLLKDLPDNIHIWEYAR